jgi:hypothetical protein
MVTGAMRSTVLWNRSVAVSAGPTATASCRTMSPASSSSFIMCAVTPTSGSPLISAQISGEKPAYFGSSESCTFSVPWRGRSKMRGGIHVRQLLATMMSGSASLRRSNSSSSSGRLRITTGTPFSSARSATESLQIFSYACSLLGCVTTRTTSCSESRRACRVRCPQVW